MGPTSSDLLDQKLQGGAQLVVKGSAGDSDASEVWEPLLQPCWDAPKMTVMCCHPGELEFPPTRGPLTLLYMGIISAAVKNDPPARVFFRQLEILELYFLYCFMYVNFKANEDPQSRQGPHHAPLQPSPVMADSRSQLAGV